jgi:hypothetical protein
MSSLYLYGLIGAEPNPETPLGESVAGEPLAILRVGGLLAVVGRLETDAERPEVTAAALARHDKTVRRLALLVPALLPARFGEQLPDAAALAEALAPRAAEITRALILVEGCVQMTLRVFGEPAVSAIESAEPVETDSAAGPGTRYLAARRRAAHPGLPEVAALRQSLKPLVRAERIERHSRKPVQGQLLATAHDLVLRENAADYRRTVEGATAALLAGRKVSVSGPWPPYAFAPGGAFRGTT